jgi:hypothetical protein
MILLKKWPMDGEKNLFEMEKYILFQTKLEVFRWLSYDVPL